MTVTKTFQAVRGYNGVQNLSQELDLGVAGLVSADAVYRGGDGVPPDLGPESMADSDMSESGTGSWIPISDANLSKGNIFPYPNDQYLRIEYGGTALPQARQNNVTKIKKYYVVTGFARGDGTARPYVRPGSVSTIWDGTTSTDWQPFCVVFQAQSDIMRLYSTASSAANYSDFGQISVKEITPIYTAFGGYLPGLAGDTLYTANDGTCIDWGSPGYGNLQSDYAVTFNRDQFLASETDTYLDFTGQSMALEIVGFWDGTSTETIYLSKADPGGAGYRLQITAVGGLSFFWSDGTSSVDINMGTVAAGSVFHAIVFIDESSEGVGYLNTAQSAVEDFSVLGSISNTELFSLGAYSNGTSPTGSSVIYTAVWRTDERFPVTITDFGPQVLERFLKWMGVWPDTAYGTEAPDSRNFGETYIEEYDETTGTVSYHKTPNGTAPIGKIRDANGSVFYGLRLAGEQSELIDYSNDFNTGWSLNNVSVYTGELIETPVPGIYAQGIVPDTSTGTHYIQKSLLHPAGQYCYQFLVYAGGLEWAMVFITSIGGRVNFHLTGDGAIGFTNNIDGAHIEALGNGWYRCCLVATLTGTTNLSLYCAEDDNDLVFQGDNVTPGIWAAFANVRLGNAPGPLIYTNGFTSFRDTDTLVYRMSDGNMPSGTWVLKFEVLSPYGQAATGVQPVFRVGSFFIGIDASTGALDIDSGTAVGTINIADNVTHDVEILFGGADGVKAYIDGVLDIDDPTLNIGAGHSTLTLTTQVPRNTAGNITWLRDVRIFTESPQSRIYGPGGEQEGDVLIYQTNDDGDINVVDGITELTPTFPTMIYLTLFGGNEDDPGTEDTDRTWWGNYGESDPAYRYRSETQNIMYSISANTANLIKLQGAVERDLKRAFVDTGIASSVTVDVAMPRLNWVDISGNIVADGELTKFEFSENWEASV